MVRRWLKGTELIHESYLPSLATSCENTASHRDQIIKKTRKFQIVFAGLNIQTFVDIPQLTSWEAYWRMNGNNLRCRRHNLLNILKLQTAFCIQFITNKQVKLVSFTREGSICRILILVVPLSKGKLFPDNQSYMDVIVGMMWEAIWSTISRRDYIVPRLTLVFHVWYILFLYIGSLDIKQFRPLTYSKIYCHRNRYIES